MMARFHRWVFIGGFLISSAVISTNLGAPAEQSSTSGVNSHSSAAAHTTSTVDNAIDATWKFLRSTICSEVLQYDRTVKQDPDEEDRFNVINVLRGGGVEPKTDISQPVDHSEDQDADYYYRTDTEEDSGTSWSDDRTDGAAPYQGTVQQLRGVQRLPQAIIIGVKKGGTRALLEFLRIHPDVRAPGPEIHFFDKNYHKGLDWYRSQMPPTISGQITVEKTPSYWITKGVPGRLFNMSRDVRLIVVVRDPSTRALSDYTQAITKRPNLGRFERMAFLDNATGLVDTSWGAIRIGVYVRHLERWLEYFPRESVHFVNGEKLISDPAGELATVQDFLKLKRIITDKHFYFNATKGFPCLKKSEGSGSPRCLGKTKGRPHPSVDDKVLQRLRDFYRPFNEKFYEMTGINFEWP